MDSSCIQGINKMKKPATRVMAPPGGRSQLNIFGNDSPPPRTPVNENQKRRNNSSIFDPPVDDNNNSLIVDQNEAEDIETDDTAIQEDTELEEDAEKEDDEAEDTVTTPTTMAGTPPDGRTDLNLFAGDSSPPPAPVTENQRKRNESFIFDPPEDNNNNNNSVNTKGMGNVGENNTSTPVRPSTRVMAPPGGKTSINLFG